MLSTKHGCNLARQSTEHLVFRVDYPPLHMNIPCLRRIGIHRAFTSLFGSNKREEKTALITARQAHVEFIIRLDLLNATTFMYPNDAERFHIAF